MLSTWNQAQKHLASIFICLVAVTSPMRAAHGVTAPPDAASLTPAVVVAGSPELIRVDASSAASVEGEWLGRKVEFFRGPNGHAWFALAGVDVEAAAGPSTLHVTAHKLEGRTVDLSRAIEIHPAHYRTGSLTVAPKFVEPDAASLEQIKAEVVLKAKTFAASASEPLWISSFRAPVAAPSTDSFGTRRMFNGKLASIHKGMDFHAATGTPVHAANGGVVVLARPLYYEGNCVVIDHGLGLYTISMHLSRIEVKEGQSVTAGELIGLSGATGRVTGPHLHWAVRWHDAYLDPAKLLALDLSAAR
jgi:murein DD-endopeptidase MepM/ murein hydrolase activator NlpD